MFDSITDFFWGLIYDICTFLCWIVQCIYETFEIFAGLRYVKLNGEDTVMFDVFFNNDSIYLLYFVLKPYVIENTT